MRKNRSYTKEFKVEACKLVVNDGLKVKLVAEKMGVSHIMLYRWIEEYNTYGNEAFVGKGRLRAEDAELKKLKKENERLREEVEILKKAAAYFTKHPGKK